MRPAHFKNVVAAIFTTIHYNCNHTGREKVSGALCDTGSSGTACGVTTRLFWDEACPQSRVALITCCPGSCRSQLPVHFLVLDQVPMLVEGTAALPALVGLLARVDPLVLDEH